MNLKPKTRRQAIRLKCLECMGNSRAEIVRCTKTDCSLFEFRMNFKKKYLKQAPLMQDNPTKSVEPSSDGKAT